MVSPFRGLTKRTVVTPSAKGEPYGTELGLYLSSAASALLPQSGVLAAQRGGLRRRRSLPAAGADPACFGGRTGVRRTAPARLLLQLSAQARAADHPVRPLGRTDPRRGRSGAGRGLLAQRTADRRGDAPVLHAAQRLRRRGDRDRNALLRGRGGLRAAGTGEAAPGGESSLPAGGPRLGIRRRR